MQDRELTLYTSNGKEVKASILFTYHSDEFEKDYVVFLVKETNEVSAAVYKTTSDNEGELEAIQTEEEWKLLEELVNDYANESDENAANCSCGGGCSGCSGCGGSCGGDCNN